MNILTKIEQNSYLADDKDVEALARERQSGLEFGTRAGATYLRILVARTASQCGPKPGRRRKLKPEETTDHLTQFESVQAACYAAVSKAVVTADIEASEQLSAAEASRRALERNRRTNYARTAASVLRLYITSGQDVRLLDASTVTKGALRDALPARAPAAPSEQRIAGRAKRTAERVLQDAGALAAIDKRKAEAMLADLIERLDDALQKIRAGEAPVLHARASARPRGRRAREQRAVH